ncbi:MAG: hypothetical protein HXS50_02615 [Theionarchaea archaeon]|nr:hypothetical protein [Theionarchaea archaeon]
MDPEELQEVGLFLLLGIIWVMLMGTNAGEYKGIIDIMLIVLFVAGVSLIAYGMLLMRRTGKLMKGGKDLREGE